MQIDIPSSTHRPSRLLVLLTADEVANWLRTSKKAIYALVGHGRLPGVVRVGRRVLLRRDALLDWLLQKSAKSKPAVPVSEHDSIACRLRQSRGGNR
jgi:excisionase family DNA binding protein